MRDTDGEITGIVKLIFAIAYILLNLQKKPKQTSLKNIKLKTSEKIRYHHKVSCIAFCHKVLYIKNIYILHQVTEKNK